MQTDIELVENKRLAQKEKEQMQEKNKTALEDTKTDNKQTNTISK